MSEKRDFLLGNLDEKRRSAIEEKILADDGYYEDIVVEEDEIADEYAAGVLKSEEQAAFERRVAASPRLRRKVSFSKAMRRRAADEPLPFDSTRRDRRRPGLLVLAMAASLVLVLSAAVWLATENAAAERNAERLTAMLAQERTSEAAPQAAGNRAEREAHLLERLQRADREAVELRSEVDRLRAASSAVVSLALSSAMTRGDGGVEKLALPAETERLRLQLEIDREEAEAYRVVISNMRGETVWSESGVRSAAAGEKRNVVIELPARVIERGSYEVSLMPTGSTSDLDAIAFYEFDVVGR